MAAFAPAVPAGVPAAAAEVVGLGAAAGVVVGVAGEGTAGLAGAAVEATAGGTGTPLAVDVALSWAWTAGENVPVMPVKVNFDENARAGTVDAAGSLRLMDSKRMKYWSLLAPTLGSGVNSTVAAVETSRLAVMSWSWVCC